jgi:pilus assembly protein Flp/PilA
MLSMFRVLRKFRKDEKGATAIEYALIAALISVAAIAAFSAVGGQIGTTMNNVKANMTPGGATSGGTGG